jgi:hypothetical protein
MGSETAYLFDIYSDQTIDRITISNKLPLDVTALLLFETINFNPLVTVS